MALDRPGRAQRGTPAERLVDAVRVRPLVVDGLLALVVLVVGVNLAVSGPVVQADRGGAVVVAVLLAVAIVLRRRYPMPVAVTVAVIAAVSQLTVPGASVAILLGILVVGYSAVAYGPRWAGPLTAAVMVLGATLPLVRALVAGAPGASFALSAGIVVVVGLLTGTCVWFAGALRRAHLSSAAALRERARLLEEGRRREVRIELLAERSRISREVHDVVAHSLSGIIALADGGRYAAQQDPRRAVEVLDGIATSGREALGDIRGLLGGLRSAAPDGDLDDERADGARPRVDDVPVLVDQVRAGGLPVTLTTSGTPRSMEAGAGLAVYRVVQEALTNVVKHAGPATPTEVTLDWGADELEVAVRDRGPGGARPSLPRGGHGLMGMRERAALLGGGVDAAPTDEGGFLVRLRLPLPVAARPAAAVTG